MSPTAMTDLVASLLRDLEVSDSATQELMNSLRAARRIDGGSEPDEPLSPEQRTRERKASDDARLRLLSPLLKTTKVDVRLTSLRRGYEARLEAVASAAQQLLAAAVRFECDRFLIAEYTRQKDENDNRKDAGGSGRRARDHIHEPAIKLADRLAQSFGVHYEHLKLLTEDDDREIARIVRARVAACARPVSR